MRSPGARQLHLIVRRRAIHARSLVATRPRIVPSRTLGRGTEPPGDLTKGLARPDADCATDGSSKLPGASHPPAHPAALSRLNQDGELRELDADLRLGPMTVRTGHILDEGGECQASGNVDAKVAMTREALLPVHLVTGRSRDFTGSPGSDLDGRAGHWSPLLRPSNTEISCEGRASVWLGAELVSFISLLGRTLAHS